MKSSPFSPAAGGASLVLLLALGCGREGAAQPGATTSLSQAAATDGGVSPDAHDRYATAGISCEKCHPCGSAPVHTASWMDEASPGFHALSANAGLANCQSCHGGDLEGTGSSSIACASCHGAAWKTNCTMCHGGTDNPTGAPPRVTWGNAADPVRSGAHTSHLAATRGVSQPVACEVCHVQPADALAAAHIDGATATVTFSGRAQSGGARPVWTRDTASCASTYCHGGTLAAGGTNTAPVWTRLDGTQAACGTCHGVPPPLPHPDNAACEQCHPGYTSTTVDVQRHVNGTLDVVLNCTSCHGDAARDPAIAAAPPRGTHAETDTGQLAVGAHLQHLQAGPFSKAMACEECHAVPGSALHANGTVDLAFGTLARTGNTTPVWSRDTATCSSTWCHGGTLAAGGTNTAPLWTRVNGTQAACGTCHGVPPPPPHPTDASCDHCHTGYTASTVNLDNHVNGKVDVVLTCNSCHGSAANDAPPLGTQGETLTTARAVGAHQKHLRATLSQPVACSECHVVPGTIPHANGAAEVTFGALARSGGAAANWNGTSCSSTYCHGATLAAGGTNTAPAWTRVDGTQAACGTCHGVPPPAPHPIDANCGHCHAGYTSTTVDPQKHVNGTVDVVLNCTSCHGDASRAATALNPKLAAAPPTGTKGETATTTRAVGAHQQHLQDGTLSGGIACSECHLVPSDASPAHQNGTVLLTWGPLATKNGSIPAWNPSTNTCSANWCHGAKLTGGSLRTPVWTKVDGTQDRCGTCHGIPPTSGQHGRSEHRVSCGYCHGGTYTQTVADKTRHFDGVFEVNGPRIRTWNASTHNCQPTCHGTETW